MELHDIFSEIHIVEYSFYAFFALCLVGLALLFFLYKLIKNRRKKMHPLHILKRYNPNDAKQTAQQVSYYGKKLAKSETQKKLLHSLEVKLESYKYLKTSQPLSDALQEEIEQFIHSIRHKNV